MFQKHMLINKTKDKKNLDNINTIEINIDLSDLESKN